MPPKTKGKKGAKGKSSAVVDGLSTEEMSKDQLEEHIVRLREELDREREERSYFQLERDKIQAFWENCKRTVEETKARIRNRHREREEAEERHRVEITEYKQKMRHVLFEHDNTAFEQKMDGLASTSLIQNQHAQAELGLRRDARGLQANFRDKKLENENLIKELNLKHQVELIELINDHDRRVREMELKYHKQMQSMTEAANKTLEVEVNDFDSRVKRRAETLTEEHHKALRGAQEYFSGIKNKMLEDQKLLERQVAEASKAHAQVHRKLSVSEQEHKRLHESLQETEQKLPELQRQLEEYNRAKVEEARSRARVKVIEKETRDLMMEHEMLLQAFEKVQEERDDLLKKQREAVLDVQQKSGLTDLLLERKLAVLTDTVEKKEAQLCSALAASNIDQTAGSSAANKLEEILESKQAAIDAFRRELARDCEEYDDLLQTCRQRLKDLGVPLYSFSFRPSHQILGL